ACGVVVVVEETVPVLEEAPPPPPAAANDGATSGAGNVPNRRRTLGRGPVARGTASGTRPLFLAVGIAVVLALGVTLYLTVHKKTPEEKAAEAFEMLAQKMTEATKDWDITEIERSASEALES